MKRAIFLMALTLVSGMATARVMWDQNTFTVIPFDFDPGGTHLVEAEWEDGIGCVSNYNIPTSSPQVVISYLNVGPPPTGEVACPTGDPRDKLNEGLFMAKTGPSSNNASSGAVITGVQGITLKELGYDLRKPGTGTSVAAVNAPGDQNDPRGSHCGNGAPRFNVVLYDEPNTVYFVGCNSPPPDANMSGLGWQRLRWGNNGTIQVPLLAFPVPPPSPPVPVPVNISGRTVKRLSIVFDEGDDTGPDNFGFAVLDNIDINGTLVGRGPEQPEDSDRDEGQGEDSDHDKFQFHDSPSRPESSNVSYQDRSRGMKVQSVNGARSVTYNGACVALLTDALVNEEPGYLLAFTACNLPGPLGLGIGNLVVAVTGPAGLLYQKSAVITSGFVTIHPH